MIQSSVFSLLISATISLIPTLSFSQELKPVRSSWKTKEGSTSNFKASVKGDKCLGTAKFKRNDREDSFDTLYEWTAIQENDRILCKNGKFTNTIHSGNNAGKHTFSMNWEIQIIKGNAYQMN